MTETGAWTWNCAKQKDGLNTEDEQGENDLYFFTYYSKCAEGKFSHVVLYSKAKSVGINHAIVLSS